MYAFISVIRYILLLVHILKVVEVAKFIVGSLRKESREQHENRWHFREVYVISKKMSRLGLLRVIEQKIPDRNKFIPIPVNPYTG